MNFLYLNRLYKDIMNIYGNKKYNNYMNSNPTYNSQVNNNQNLMNTNLSGNNLSNDHFNYQMPQAKGNLPYVRLPNVNYNAVNQYYKDRIKSFLYKQI